MEGVNPNFIRLIRNLADTKLRQSNEGSEDLLTKRPLHFPDISSVL